MKLYNERAQNPKRKALTERMWNALRSTILRIQIQLKHLNLNFEPSKAIEVTMTDRARETPLIVQPKLIDHLPPHGKGPDLEQGATVTRIRF